MALSLIQMKAQFQDPMRQGIVDLLWQSSRVMQEVSFIEHSGLSYAYTQRGGLPGVAFRSLNDVFAPTVGVVNPAVETLTILGGKIRTDSVQIRMKGPAARQNQITAQLEATAKFFDKNFFNGDPSTNPKSFLGLKKRLVGSQLLTNATNGAVPSYKKVIELLDAVEGDNGQKVLFMNRTARRLLSEDVGTAAGGRNVMDVGRQLTTFEGAKVVEVFKDETESEILPFTETCGNNSLSSSIYCVRFGGQVDERGVQAITGLSEKIEATGPYNYGEYQEDVIQMVVGLGVFGGYVAARLQGVKAS
jgi:hypothetical protein